MADRTPSRGRSGRPGSAGRGGGRSAPRSRPGGSTRSGGPRTGRERPAPAPRVRTERPVEPPSVSNIWVRAAIIASILVMLAVAIVPTLRSLLQQRAEATALRERVAAQEVTVAELQREAELWRDPAYIEVQARERLGFVRVGDRAYTVIGAGPQRPDPPDGLPAVAAPMANDASPWYGKVWQSIQIADRPTAGMYPQK